MRLDRVRLGGSRRCRRPHEPPGPPLERPKAHARSGGIGSRRSLEGSRGTFADARIRPSGHAPHTPRPDALPEMRMHLTRAVVTLSVRLDLNRGESDHWKSPDRPGATTGRTHEICVEEFFHGVHWQSQLPSHFGSRCTQLQLGRQRCHTERHGHTVDRAPTAGHHDGDRLGLRFRSQQPGRHPGVQRLRHQPRWRGRHPVSADGRNRARRLSTRFLWATTARAGGAKLHNDER